MVAPMAELMGELMAGSKVDLMVVQSDSGKE
jgi:hypothetical protein